MTGGTARRLTVGLKVAASFNGSGQLVLTATDTVNITVGAALGGAGTTSSVLGISTGTTSFVPNATRTSFASQYNALRAQVDQLVADASYNNVNLLSGGSVTATFNETGSSKYTAGGTAVSASGLGLSSITANFQKDTEVNAALTALTSAVASLANLSAQFSAASSVIDTRDDFTSSMIDLLDSGADNLVAADVNEAGAALLALQSRQQIAATALSLSADSDSLALRLFGLG